MGSRRFGFERRGRQRRLLAAFGVLAGIALLLAGVGYWSTQRVGAYAAEVGGKALPGMENLPRAQLELETVRVAQRTLLSPGLSGEERSRQAANATRAQKEFEQRFGEFRRLAGGAAPTEVEVFARQVKAWEDVSARFLRLMEELRATDVTNPVALEAQQEGFKGDHHLAIQRAATQIFQGQAYAGGADPTACRFGRWLTTYRTANPAVRAVMERSVEPHRRFHGAVAAIQAALTAGDRAAAQRAGRPRAPATAGAGADVPAGDGFG